MLSVYFCMGDKPLKLQPLTHIHIHFYICVCVQDHVCVHAYLQLYMHINTPPTYKMHMWSTYAHACRTHTTTTYICMGI